jgi:hypothetical protein
MLDRTAGQLADIFIKALGRVTFLEPRRALGIIKVQHL